MVPIETPEGKAEYARRQRGLAVRADALRERILEEIEAVAEIGGHAQASGRASEPVPER